MRDSILSRPLLGLLLASLPTSAQVIDDLSFGNRGNLSPSGNGIPGWGISSVNHNPQILSDRILLTPPVGGNTRGALWTDKTIDQDAWIAELEFRTMGQEGGSGNIQFWYTKDKGKIDTDSVYTVDSFDGMALLVDKYGGSGGSIRGFLNDGQQSFKGHSNIESLAFGHCQYSYRNLGRPSKLTVSNDNGLTVSIDDRECFSTDKVSLPSGYYFGITAATPDIPDSFEVLKFIVSASDSYNSQQQQSRRPSAHHGNQARGNDQPPQLQRLDRFPGSPEAVPDQSADEISSQPDQFADLHNRLQGLTHQIANMFGEFDALARQIDERHQQIFDALPSIGSNANTNNNNNNNNNEKSNAMLQDAISQLNRRLEGLERNVEAVRKDVEGKDYRNSLDQLNRAIESVKGGLTDGLPDTISGSESTSLPFPLSLFPIISLSGLCFCFLIRH